MAQEKVYLPELNDRMAKKLRVQDSFTTEESNEETQELAEVDNDTPFEDVNLNGLTETNNNNNTNNNTTNNTTFNTTTQNNNNDSNNHNNSNVYRTVIYPNSPTKTTHYITTSNAAKVENEKETEKEKEDEDDDIDFGVLIVEFAQLTGEEDQGKILAVLEKNNWKLDAAVSSFLDEQDSRYYYQPTISSPYHSNTSLNMYGNSGQVTSTSTTTTTSTSTDYTNYDSYQRNHHVMTTDHSSRDEMQRHTTTSRYDDNDDIEAGYRDDESSMYANPDTTRQDVSEDDESEDEAYLKSLGFPASTAASNRNDHDYQPTTTTSTKKYDKNDYVAFQDTLEDHIENKTTAYEEKNYPSPEFGYSNDNYNNYDNNNNNNNNTTNSNSNSNNNNNTNDNNNNNNTTSTYNIYNNYDNNTNTENSFNNYKNKYKTPSFAPSLDFCTPVTDQLGYNSKYYCKLGQPGSGGDRRAPVIRGRTSLRLLCVDKLTGLIITHEKLIELLHLCEVIDCYAFHQLIFATASRCYYTIRNLPTFQKLSPEVQSRIQDFVGDDSWD